MRETSIYATGTSAGAAVGTLCALVIAEGGLLANAYAGAAAALSERWSPSAARASRLATRLQRGHRHRCQVQWGARLDRHVLPRAGGAALIGNVMLRADAAHPALQVGMAYQVYTSGARHRSAQVPAARAFNLVSSPPIVVTLSRGGSPDGRGLEDEGQKEGCEMPHAKASLTNSSAQPRTSSMWSRNIAVSPRSSSLARELAFAAVHRMPLWTLCAVFARCGPCERNRIARCLSARCSRSCRRAAGCGWHGS